MIEITRADQPVPDDADTRALLRLVIEELREIRSLIELALR